jgi:hypothetical protein
MAATSTRSTVLAVLLGLLGLGLFMGLVWVGCSAFLKNNDAYRQGVAAALADPSVGELLGAPVAEGLFINGEIEHDGMDAYGTWLVRLRGEAHSGTLRIIGHESMDAWRVVGLVLETQGQRYRYVAGSGFEPDRGDEMDLWERRVPPDLLRGTE